MKCKISLDRAGLGDALEFVEKKLREYKLGSKDITKNILATEEVINSLLAHSDNADYVYLSVRRESQGLVWFACPCCWHS